MKIILFTDTFLPQINGVVTSVVNFSRELAKKGHIVYIFTTKKKRQPKINLGKNVYIHYFPSGNWFIDYPDLRLVNPQIVKTMSMVSKIKPDIIHVNAPSPHAWTALLCARVYKIPIIGTYHTLISDFLKHSKMKHVNPKIGKKLTWDYTRAYYNNLDLVIAPSEAIRKELIGQKIKKEIKVVSNGVDTNLFYPEKMQKKGNRVLHVGRISYEKNIDVLLKAFKIVLRKIPDARLDIVGEGPNLEELRLMSRKLNIDKNVRFLGRIEHTRLRQVYCAYDTFATASTIETEGLVILEAMACGLPVIGVNCRAIPYIVKNDFNGYVAEPYNEREIAEGIKRIMMNAKLRQRFSLNSIKTSKKFSLENSVQAIEKIYERTASEKKKKDKNWAFRSKAR
jgi:glycosyltransferase involved in cell wall biosynthesis